MTAPLGAVTMPLRIVAVGAAVFATTATSCAESGVVGIAAQDGVLYADTSGGVWASSDGGVSWDDIVDFSADQTCVADRCYELVRTSSTDTQVTGPGYVTTVDLVVGPERMSILSVAERDLSALHEVVTVECGLNVLAGIVATGGESGDVVLVAMGDAGVMRRASGGEWEWVAVGEHGIDDASAEPLGVAVGSASPGPGFDWPLWISRALLVAVPLVAAALVRPIGALAGRRRRDGDAASRLTMFVAVVSGLLTVAVLVLAGGGDFSPAVNVMGVVLIGAATAAALIALAIVYGRPKPAALQPPRADQRVG